MTGEELSREALVRYLSALSGVTVEITAVQQLGGGKAGAAALKAFGYGRPLLIDYAIAGAPRQAVLRRVNRNGFGRERASDRVAEVWRDFHTFNRLPHHVRAQDMVGLAENGRLSSLAHVTELLLLTDYAPGAPYADDLLRIRENGAHTPQDLARARRLAAYLADVHSRAHDDPLLWRRRLRDLIGHGEGIMGLTDSYQLTDSDKNYGWVTIADLRAIEEAANRWRWRLKPLTHRLRQVHGDFHPFNVLFSAQDEFTLIDRSRGAWGEPADDVSCMTINYLFFALPRYGRLAGPFAELHMAFWETYLARRPDDELPAVIAPWFAWRALVLASPQWYPTLTDAVRRRLLTFGRRVMDAERFDWRDVNQYLEAAA
jgi:aminoglycoside phosphotransferase (APT) family kinase protein